MKELASFSSSLPLLAGMAAFFVFVLITVPSCGLAQVSAPMSNPVYSDPDPADSGIQNYHRYRIHDVEDASSLTRVKWAARWIGSPISFGAEVLPLYAYELCPDPAEDESCDEPKVVCTSDINTPRRLNFISSLLLGERTWNPAEYELEYAGLVRQDPSGSDGALTGLLLDLPGRTASADLTLGHVCDEIGNLIASEEGGANGTVDYGNWLLVTKNPIPYSDSDRRLWTNLSEDVISASQPSETAQSSAGE